MEGDLQELCPGSTPAQGRRGRATDLFVKMLCGENRMMLCVAIGISPPASCWVVPGCGTNWGLMASESGGHERQCPGRSNETQAAWELNYSTNIPQTGSKRTNPSRNIQIQKVKSSRKPWNVDRSSEKQNVANSSRRARRDVPSVAGFPSRWSSALVTDSLWGSLSSAT